MQQEDFFRKEKTKGCATNSKEKECALPIPPFPKALDNAFVEIFVHCPPNVPNQQFHIKREVVNVS